MKNRNRFNRMSVGPLVLVLAIIMSSLVGCAAADPIGPVVSAASLQSDKPRLPAPPLGEAHLPELIEGNTEFAFDLYHVLLDKEENLFYSPYSLSEALAMTYAEARGETEQQMADALHYTLSQDQLHPAFNALTSALISHEKDEGKGSLFLRIVNAIWTQQGYSFLDPFLDTLAEQYGAGLRAVDFGQAEEARQTINQWGNQETEGRIEELLSPGAVGAETALVLANAVAFKAEWMHPFVQSNPGGAAFTLLDGEQVVVPFMEQSANLGYAERAGVRAVELPYAGGTLSMVILAPDAGTFESFARDLDAAEMNAILSDLTPEQVRLTMPKFELNTDLELADALVGLGMVNAFADADFSGMDGSRELFIDQVYHSASVTVDEEGTEAAASSAVVVNRKGGPGLSQELTLDRPFVFVIRDLETEAILFLGHVVNPAG